VDEYHCSFCGKRREEVGRLISGPLVFICDACVARCREMIDAEPPQPAASPAAVASTCSFCGKRRDEVSALIASGRPPHKICNECITLCEEIIAGG
jgi:ATP-dependent protease Clp ATPase subunit